MHINCIINPLAQHETTMLFNVNVIMYYKNQKTLNRSDTYNFYYNVMAIERKL